MKVEDFDYTLPSELIAQYPLENRTKCRLLAYDRCDQSISHHTFSDLLNFVSPGDILVFNDTKVMPARLYAKKSTGGKVEIFIERILSEHRVLALLNASKSVKIGSRLYINDNVIDVLDREGDFYILNFNVNMDLIDFLHEFGHIPLPPYIQREDTTLDIDRYQTVYAKNLGAVAAPTAGLHFDNKIIKKLKDKGVLIEHITLHVGSGTFQPVRVSDITDHTMHKESYSISQKTCDRINEVKACGNKVIAVGTTVVRTLESSCQDGKLMPFSGDTSIFIYPGYKFKIIDEMLTNFHLPKSTLLMLISAFTSIDEIKRIYRAAIEEKYRFFSYGDTMYIRSRG